MMLKGSQRGGAKQLALHLLNTVDNDHVEVHSIDGFVSDDVTGALREIYAISRATRCKQFMFSLSLSPPKDAVVTIEDYEAAIQAAAERLGLSGQPKVVLFHEKHGRRHCHVVFSRIAAPPRIQPLSSRMGGAMPSLESFSHAFCWRVLAIVRSWSARNSTSPLRPALRSGA